MMATLVEAALRSLVLAIGVWVALRAFRIRNVLALKSAWTLVLAAAFLMPLLLPISSRLPRATLVLPVFTHRAAPATPAPPSEQIVAARNAQPALAMPHRSLEFAGQPDDTSSPATTPGHFSVLPAPAHGPSARAAAHPALPVLQAATLLYLAISGLLLVRLVYGLISAYLLWRSAKPASAERTAAHGLRLRASGAVSSPVTIGSSVIVPADYTAWGSDKLRVVLAHERSHIRQGDFYLQALAGLYAAIFWFSPLGWWLKRQLSDLAEAISDRTGLEEAASRASYAQILLEFAAAPRPTLIGVAMARSSNLSHRIERLFNDGAFRQAFTASRRALATALLVPVVLFAATTLVRVAATAQTPQHATPAQNPTPATSPEPAQPATPPDAAPSAVAAPEAAPLAGPSPAPAAPARVQVPAVHVNVPAIHVKVPAQHIEVPAIHIDVPAQHIDVPAQHVDVPSVHVDVPAQHIDVPAQHIDVPAIHIDVPSGTPSSFNGHAANGSGGELLAMLNGFGHALFLRANADTTQAVFDRSLSFNGKLELSVATGSGNITLTPGSSNQVRIHGIVKGNQKADPAQVQQIAANPPIEQEGNTIRIGGHNEKMQNISIDYEVEAPAESALNAATGSGNIVDNGVGQEAKLITGSGNIQAKGIQGGFKAQTGSGNIEIDGTGAGDAKAQTGSGDIELKGVQGSLDAQTGSGSIKAEGKPSSAWKLEAGSGDIELATGSAPVNLDASTGSGEIKTNRSEAMESSSDHHHVRAQLNGGGPELKAETGSGDIRID